MEYTPLCFGSFEEPTCIICPFITCCKDMTFKKQGEPKKTKGKKQAPPKSKKSRKKSAKHKKSKLSIIDA